MSFLEIRLTPFANCVTQGYSWAGSTQLRGSQPRGYLGAGVQPVLGSPSPGGEITPAEEGRPFSNLLEGTATSLSHTPTGQRLLRGHLFPVDGFVWVSKVQV